MTPSARVGPGTDEVDGIMRKIPATSIKRKFAGFDAYPDDLVIATKVWPGRDRSGEWWWASPA
jgi:hypothetical protein